MQEWKYSYEPNPQPTMVNTMETVYVHNLQNNSSYVNNESLCRRRMQRLFDRTSPAQVSCPSYFKSIIHFK